MIATTNNQTIRCLRTVPTTDGSLQKRMESTCGYVDFAILDGELCAHTWECPGEGRRFLKALEEHAKKNGLKLTIPTVLNPKLKHILKDTGYEMKKVWDEYMGEYCELWSKDK